MRFVDRSDTYSVFTLADKKEYLVTDGQLRNEDCWYTCSLISKKYYKRVYYNLHFSTYLPWL